MQTSYDYDTANRLTKITYPVQYGFGTQKRRTVIPLYDQASRLTQMNVGYGGAKGDSVTQLSDISYNTFGQVTQLKTGLGTGNPDVEQYTYDSQTGLLANQKVIHTNTSATLLDLSYSYWRGNSVGLGSGKTGQLTSITNNLDHNKDRSFEYDGIGRLTAAKGGLAAGATGVTANWSQTYGYDRYGNRTSVTASGITADSNNVPSDGLTSLGFDTSSNRINTAGWQYDNAGNLMRGQNQSGTWLNFEYDAAGRLVKVMDDASPTHNTLETYTYGADRNRLICETPSQRTYYAWGGSSVIQEYTEPIASSIPVYSKSYVYAGSRLLSTATVVSGSEVTEFHHPDRLGTKLVTNPAANTNFEQSTLPFGTELPAENSGTGSTNQKFTTYDRSAGTGLDYAINRTHSSGQGRFTQVDPMGVAASSQVKPQSLNLYAYAANEPVEFVDPSGLLIRCHDEFRTTFTCVSYTDDTGTHTDCGFGESGWVHVCEEIPGTGPTGDPGTRGVGGGGGPSIGPSTNPPVTRNPCGGAIPVRGQFGVNFSVSAGAALGGGEIAASAGAVVAQDLNNVGHEQTAFVAPYGGLVVGGSAYSGGGAPSREGGGVGAFFSFGPSAFFSTAHRPSDQKGMFETHVITAVIVGLTIDRAPDGSVTNVSLGPSLGFGYNWFRTYTGSPYEVSTHFPGNHSAPCISPVGIDPRIPIIH